MAEMESLVSVVVCIYNTEKYLPKCLDSIVAQTYRNLEIILVDDGSTDSCGMICDEYARKDQRIRVFHRENGGTVVSRYVGFSVAKGEYLAFVDSDDWIAPDTYERMCGLAVADNLDMVWCNVYGVMNDGLRTVTIDYTDDAGEMMRRMLRGEVPGWSCNRLIRKSLIESVQSVVYLDDPMLEDVFLSAKLFCTNPRMGYVNAPLYYYNWTNTSSMTSGAVVMIRGINNIKHVYDYLISKDVFSEYKDDFAYLAMKAKLALLLLGDTDRAIALFPYAHKAIAAYRMKTPVSWVYWLGFNGGRLGKWMINFYLKMRKGGHRQHVVIKNDRI